MKRSLFVTVVLITLILLTVGSTGCTYLKARDHLNKGVQAFSSAQYPEAKIRQPGISIGVDDDES